MTIFICREQEIAGELIGLMKFCELDQIKRKKRLARVISSFMNFKEQEIESISSFTFESA